MGIGKSTFEFTNSRVTLGSGSTTINITSDNQSYSHKLKTVYGDIATIPAGTASYTWTPTVAQLEQAILANPNSKSFTITVTLYTYNGSTEVGWDSKYLGITLGNINGLVPVISKSVAPDELYVSYNDTLINTVSTFGGILSGVGSLRYQTSITNRYGTTTDYTTVSFGNSSSSNTSGSFIAVNEGTSNQTQTFKIYTQDKRGFSSTYTQNFTVIPYKKPTFINVEVKRCESTGAIREDGTCIKIITEYSITSLSNKNSKTLRIGFKLSTSSSYEYSNVNLSSYSSTYSFIVSRATFTPEASIDVRLFLRDSIYETQYDYSLCNKGTIMELSADGKSIIFGNSASNNILINDECMNIRKGLNKVTEFDENYIGFVDNKCKIYSHDDYLTLESSNIDPRNASLHVGFVAGTNMNMYTRDDDREASCSLSVTSTFDNDDWANKASINMYSESFYDYYSSIDILCEDDVGRQSSIAMTSGTMTLSSPTGVKIEQPSLYDNTSGTAGTVTLSGSSAIYSRLEIFFRTISDVHSSVVVYSPSGKNVTLSAAYTIASDSTTCFYQRTVSISGTTISNVSSGPYSYIYFKNGGTATRTVNNLIFITKVIGYK